ncbi:MAG: response regulator transcription factor [Bacteroidetes bacterium]|nr:response regulator transcription factor [Bacteroidota bacterium]MBU2585641.1 response regulator transcription factor [Bacteroidota bacterium]
MNIKVAVIEDHKEFRESIAMILNSVEGFKCIGKFQSVEDALSSMTEPDVILLDINLPGMSGVDGIKPIKELFPKVKIIMLTVFDDDSNVFSAISAGAEGYILKKTPPLRVLQSIEDALSDGLPMTPTIAKRIINLFKNHLPQKRNDEVLTKREQEILTLIVEGFSSNKISEELFISLQTVRNHIRHIYEKLHVHSKSHAVAKAIKERLV